MMMTPEMRERLVHIALEARKLAYAPYSHHPVGAALLTASGRIVTGVNVENAAFPTGTCAEQTAVFKAVSEGERKFEAIAVVTENGGSPCGACRQVLSEFGLDLLVLIADGGGRIVWETTLDQLLPGAFGPAHLGK
jgi:cytidine deaminase